MPHLPSNICSREKMGRLMITLCVAVAAMALDSRESEVQAQIQVGQKIRAMHRFPSGDPTAISTG